MGRRILGGPRRPGVPRPFWADRVVPEALRLFEGLGPFQQAYASCHRELESLLILAQDRSAWKTCCKAAAFSGTVAPSGIRAFDPGYKSTMKSASALFTRNPRRFMEREEALKWYEEGESLPWSTFCMISPWDDGWAGAKGAW
eukprot:6990761-Alexandrium_andersonii.AAC.1